MSDGSTADDEATLSILYDDSTTKVHAEESATLQTRVSHGDVSLEAVGVGDRTVESLVSGNPDVMANLADKIYKTVAEARRK